jgi:hypothetical protein
MSATQGPSTGLNPRKITENIVLKITPLMLYAALPVAAQQELYRLNI